PGAFPLQLRQIPERGNRADGVIGHEQDDVGRDNPEKAARVKNAEVICGAFGVEKDSPDEKSREDEEEVYARPAAAAGKNQGIQERAKGFFDHLREAVEIEHQRDCDAAEPIELGNAL